MEPTAEHSTWSVRVHTKQLLWGCGLVAFSFLMPLLFHVANFQVLSSLERALLYQEKSDLMIAALRLVGLNTLRGIPHYVGAFFVGSSVEIRRKGRQLWVITALLMLLMLYIAYQGIELVHGIRYDMGLPALAVSSIMLLFERLDYHYIAVRKKILQIILFLAAFQFLDIMPMANHYPIGQGESSLDIKMAAVLLEGEELLNVVGMCGCLILFLFGVLIFFQLRQENSLRKLAILEKQNEDIRNQARIQEMENRTFHEVQHLVHDLKSPLTAMQALVGLLKMRSEEEERSADMEYLSRIENGIVQMSHMISEILYEDQCTEVTTQDILDVALAQISVTSYAEFVHAENHVPQAKVCVNRFLFPRALINLTQNSANAIPEGRVPAIHLVVSLLERGGAEYISFAVSDNGKGIRPEEQVTIWGRQVSGTRSSGLGLAFVRNVVDKLQGKIELTSTPFVGTTIRILLPMKGEDA